MAGFEISVGETVGFVDRMWSGGDNGPGKDLGTGSLIKPEVG